MTRKLFLTYRSLPTLLAGALVWTFGVAGVASAQRQNVAGTIDAGTTISVRNNETINSRDNDGNVYTGVVDKDVLNRNGNVAIPRGSAVELIVREISNDELALDLEAVTVNNRRYSIDAEDNPIADEQRDGIGANSRTGKYVGAGALLGAVIGAVAGGTKGAAIGAGVGAAGGAGTLVLTRGKSVNVPAESLLTFRLQQPLRTSTRSAVTANGNVSSAAYRAGLQAGRSDADRNLPRTTRSERWNTGQQRADYLAGYNQGYSGRADTNQPNPANGHVTGNPPLARTDPAVNITIGRDNNVRWQAPSLARVYVQVDNSPLKLFAEGQSGTQAAPWIEQGHVYVFIVQDLNGNEVGRDVLDLRSRRR